MNRAKGKYILNGREFDFNGKRPQMKDATL